MSVAAVAGERRIRFGVRGFGGEVGDTLTRVLMAMRQDRFKAFSKVTGGGVVTALIRHKPEISWRDTIEQDRSYLKLTGTGKLTENTASSYGYTDHIKAVEFDPADGRRVKIIGRDGRVLNIDYRRVPDTNNDLPELRELDFLIDATGANVKEVKHAPQDPNLFAQYPALTVLFSSPVKVIKDIPHHHDGLSLALVEKLNATGSCSTHAGVNEIRNIRETIINKLGIAEEEVVIEGGLFDSTHALTPSDLKTLDFYEGATLMQTTGFGGAAKKVYPVRGIGNLNATTRRYNSFFVRDGIQANGISTFSLSMTISVPRGKEPVTSEMISAGLMAAAMDPEGSKHVGVINHSFDFDSNKRTGIFTSLSLSGLTPTVMLPLGENIKVVKTEGYKVINGQEYDTYIVTVQNTGYDNRLGFTVAMLGEANRITREKLGTELIPDFHHVRHLGDELAFVRTQTGQALFAKALAATGGNLLVSPT